MVNGQLKDQTSNQRTNKRDLETMTGVLWVVDSTDSEANNHEDIKRAACPTQELSNLAIEKMPRMQLMFLLSIGNLKCFEMTTSPLWQ